MADPGKNTKVPIRMLAAEGGHFHPLVVDNEKGEVVVSPFPIQTPESLGLGVYVRLAGDTMQGHILSQPASDPKNVFHLVNQQYVDTTVTASATRLRTELLADIRTLYVPKSGGVMTGPLVLYGTPVENLHAATKGYVDGKFLRKTGVLQESTSVPILFTGAVTDTPTMLVPKEYVDEGLNNVVSAMPPPAATMESRIYRAVQDTGSITITSSVPYELVVPLNVTITVPSTVLVSITATSTMTQTDSTAYSLDMRARLGGANISTASQLTARVPHLSVTDGINQLAPGDYVIDNRLVVTSLSPSIAGFSVKASIVVHVVPVQLLAAI